MRDVKRIKRILNKIEEVWNRHPDFRFFQLLFNFTKLGTRDKIGTVRDPFRYGDDELENYLDAWLKEFKK